MTKHWHIISRAAIKAIAVGGFTLTVRVTKRHGTVQLPVIRLNGGSCPSEEELFCLMQESQLETQ